MLKRLLKPFIKNGVSDNPGLPPRAVPTEVQQLIKEARLLKSVQRYDEACDKLMEAFSIKGAKDLPMKERLRLPRYMQIAGRSEDGWKLLNNMMIMNANNPALTEIVDEMSSYMYREADYRQALLYAAWASCKEIDHEQPELHSLPGMIRERIRPIVEELNLVHKIESFIKELSEHLSATMTFGLDELKLVIDRHFV